MFLNCKSNMLNAGKSLETKILVVMMLVVVLIVIIIALFNLLVIILASYWFPHIIFNTAISWARDLLFSLFRWGNCARVAKFLAQICIVTESRTRIWTSSLRSLNFYPICLYPLYSSYHHSWTVSANASPLISLCHYQTLSYYKINLILYSAL